MDIPVRIYIGNHYSADHGHKPPPVPVATDTSTVGQEKDGQDFDVRSTDTIPQGYDSDRSIVQMQERERRP